MRAALALVLLIGLMGAACNDGPPAGSEPASAVTASPPATGAVGSAVPTPPTQGTPPSSAKAARGELVGRAPAVVELTPAFGGRVFERPVEMAPYADGRFMVVDQSGIVVLLNATGADEQVVLDLSAKVLTEGLEEGMLSLALDPDFASNRLLYIYYSAAGPRRTVLSRFEVADADTIDLASELVLLEVEQPFQNHNGGAIRFGPDGLLYLGLGDGGGGGDPFGNAQDPSTLLGSIIRIDVSKASEDEPYATIDNPVDVEGARPEVWAYGFRNPWRMAFDAATDQLWVADVGQDRVEEVDIVEGGGNYGWPILEGTECYPPGSDCDPADTVGPVATYRIPAEGCAITGGFVYRGDGIPELAGTYLYADFCSGRIWALPTSLEGGPVVLMDTELQITSFGADHEGEPYVLAFGSPIMQLVRSKQAG